MQKLDELPDVVFGKEVVDEFYAKVVGVTDGDTITVLCEDQDQINIRIDSIDCPELGQAFGKEAKQATVDLVFDKRVKILQTGTDPAGLILAFVRMNPDTPDRKNLGSKLLQRGLAWDYKKYSAAKAIGWMEGGARYKKRGLWADAEPTPPWEFRTKK